MTSVQELENTVASLPKEEYNQFRHWFLDRDWDEWDRQIEEDAEAGKLDFLVKEALEARKSHKLKEL